MSVICTYCAHNNPDDLVFCQACRQPLRRTPALTESPSQPNIPRVSPFPPRNPTSQFNEGNLSFVPQVPQAPIIPIGAQQPLSPGSPIVPMGTTSAELSLSRIHAFAGRGVLLTHQSWFLSEKATAAGNMLKTSFDILRQRSILGLNIEIKNLQDYGSQTEIRHYLILRRGVATIFLYVAPAGHDLYISRATTVLTSIDAFRRFILIALIVIGVLLFIIFPISIPIWLFLIVFFAFSFRNWLLERDFWIYLRKRDLNDFQIDDVSVIEHMVDDTLRAAAKLNAIDADKLVPPTKGLAQGERISLGIPYTIAMKGDLDDQAALAFSRGFYEALGAGHEINIAYEEGQSRASLTAHQSKFSSWFFVRQ